MSKTIRQLSWIAVLVCLIIKAGEIHAGKPPQRGTRTVFTFEEIAEPRTTIISTIRPLIQAHRVLIRIPFHIIDPLGQYEPVENSTPYRTHGGVI